MIVSGEGRGHDASLGRQLEQLGRTLHHLVNPDQGRRGVVRVVGGVQRHHQHTHAHKRRTGKRNRRVVPPEVRKMPMRVGQGRKRRWHLHGTALLVMEERPVGTEQLVEGHTRIPCHEHHPTIRMHLANAGPWRPTSPPRRLEVGGF